MAYRHKLDTDGSCSRMGKRAEQRFVGVLEQMGFSHEAVDINGQFKHKDFHLAFDGSVDVKARKRISRTDTGVQDEWIWVEFQSGAGRRGWLKGKATWIAFETSTGFVVVSRMSLLDHVLRVVDFERPATHPHDAQYRLYRRGLSEIALIRMDDMVSALPHIIINTN